MNIEKDRLKLKDWKKWGPYLTERQWGTVREDYSVNAEAWDTITHDMARSKAYRWGEEGIGGFSDDQQLLCMAFAFWNHEDPILKERLFGLTGKESNHGEDVKELYYYLDATPSHSYQKMLYKYPQAIFPYQNLIEVSQNRTKLEAEYELIDTGIFDENRYFDIFIEYVKGSENDILVQLTIKNYAPESAKLTVLPTVWFRNTWSWQENSYKPNLKATTNNTIEIHHQNLGEYQLYCENADDILVTDNESNKKRLFNVENTSKYVKDGINDYIIQGNEEAINPEKSGTKASAKYTLNVEAGETKIIRLRLVSTPNDAPFDAFEEILSKRKTEADEFYAALQKDIQNDELKMIQRQAYAGMLWSKQFYYYNVYQWLQGDPTEPKPPANRWLGRNSAWQHFNTSSILSMPDAWEYPWFAAWDLAFHTLPLARLDIDFAKNQLESLLKTTYMHPSGQIPAYEWNFGDVNPPVHAWAAWKIYNIDLQENGVADFDFLESVFQKLLINFTWWVNQKDHGGNNIFEGGFLGLDNISLFDRSAMLPSGDHIEQSDGTSWMAMFSLNMFKISCELAMKTPHYQGMASKFFEHFMYIAGAMATIGDSNRNLWDEEDQFYYDMMRLANGNGYMLKIRSMVGLIPLFAVEILEVEKLDKLPELQAHIDLFLMQRPDLASLISRWNEPGKREVRLLSLLRGHRLKMLLKRMSDTEEFLSDYGVRALSKFHLNNPYEIIINDEKFSVKYAPAESESGMFGGNSNWRGPVWMPVNYLIINSLIKFQQYFGNDFKVEFPTNSGNFTTLEDVANQLSKRLISLFQQNSHQQRPVFDGYQKFQEDPNFKDLILFHEYFHGETGKGLGASHQTGWTGLIAELINSTKY